MLYLIPNGIFWYLTFVCKAQTQALLYHPALIDMIAAYFKTSNFTAFFACMFDDSLWKSYVYRTISLMSSIRIYVYFFYPSCLLFFNFTVVYIFQIKGGIPPPSGGIVGKNQSTRNMPPELPACSCDPRYQKPFWQQRLSLDLLFFPTYSIVLLNPDFWGCHGHICLLNICKTLI